MAWNALSKTSLHTWHVPAETEAVRWVFHADTFNAGSTGVADDVLYINPVIVFVPPRPPRLGVQHRPRRCTRRVGGRDGPAFGKRKTARARVQHAMDSPILAGPNLWHRTYTSNGIPFHIWVYGETTPDEQRFVQEHQDFTDAQIAHFGSFPAHYHFLYVLPEREVRHGVEHEDTTVIAQGPSAKCRTKKATWN